MDYIINELSLNGQYINVDKFYEYCTSSILPVIEHLDIMKSKDSGQLLLKKTDLYNHNVTTNTTLHQAFYSKAKDSALRIRTSLGRLINSHPFWDEAPFHNKETDYLLLPSKDKVVNTSIAEAQARKACLLSFSPSNFETPKLHLLVDNQRDCVSNVCNLIGLLDYLTQIGTPFPTNLIKWNRCEDIKGFFPNPNAIYDIASRLGVNVKLFRDTDRLIDYKINEEKDFKKKDKLKEEKITNLNEFTSDFHSKLIAYGKGKDMKNVWSEIGGEICKLNYYQYESQMSSDEQKSRGSKREIYSITKNGKKQYISLDFEGCNCFEFHDSKGKHLGEFLFNGLQNAIAKSDHDLLCLK